MNNLKFLRSVDLFGKEPFFLIRKRKKIQTSFGGIMTLIAIILAILCIVYYAVELIDKRNFSIYSSFESDSSPNKLAYDFKNFHFVFGLQGSSGNLLLDKKIFNVQAEIQTFVINSTGLHIIEHEINLTFCNQTSFDSSIVDIYKDADLTKFYCISDVQEKISKEDIFLNDYYGHDKFRMIQIKFTRCSEQDCLTEDEISNELNGGNILFYFVDLKYTSKNFKNPLHKVKRENLFPININQRSKVNHYIRHMEIITNSNALFTYFNKMGTFQHDRVFLYNLNGESDKTFFLYTLQLSNIVEKQYRTYQKLQDYISCVGGTIYLFKLFFEALLYFYNDNTLYQVLINYYFDIFPSEKDKKSFKSIKRIYFSHNVEMQNQNITTNVNNNNVSENNIKDSVSDIPIKNQRYEGFFTNANFGFFDRFISLVLCPKGGCSKYQHAYKYFHQGKEKIKEKLHITNYLQMSFDVNLLQTFLLSEENKNLMHIVCKPILSGDRKNYVSVERKMNYQQICRAQAKEIVNQRIKMGDNSYITKKLNEFINGSSHLYKFEKYE